MDRDCGERSMKFMNDVPLILLLIIIAIVAGFIIFNRMRIEIELHPEINQTLNTAVSGIHKNNLLVNNPYYVIAGTGFIYLLTIAFFRIYFKYGDGARGQHNKKKKNENNTKI